MGSAAWEFNAGILRIYACGGLNDTYSKEVGT